MEPLSTDLRVGGFDLHQLYRHGNVAVYAQSKGGRVISYEVIRIQQEKAREMFGKPYPEREVYPGSEMWGKEGWTVVDKEDALERARQLAKKP